MSHRSAERCGSRERSEQTLVRKPSGKRGHARSSIPDHVRIGSLAKLAVIATAAGAFSGLFGVGGGTVIVPLLILWFGYAEHEATGTSLAAIVVIAAFAAVAQGAYGNVDVGKGLLVGMPAVGGVLAGTVAPAAPFRAGRSRCCSPPCWSPWRSSCWSK